MRGYLFGRRCQRHSLPLAERAGFGGHADFCPCQAPAFAATAGGVEGLGVPLWTGAAGGFALGEDIGGRWRETGGQEASGGSEGGAGLREQGRRLGGWQGRSKLWRVFASLHTLVAFRRIRPAIIFSQQTSCIIYWNVESEFAIHKAVIVAVPVTFNS